MEVLLWYVFFWIGGFCFWIAFHKYFDQLADKGYAVSKFLSIAIVSLVLWIAGFLFRIPISSFVCQTVFAIFCLAFIGIFIYKRRKFPTVNFKILIASEAVFILSTLFAIYVVSIHPIIDNNTERMMDFEMLNNLTTNIHLPAKDLWFSGGNINYYYFGQFFFSVINKILGNNAYNGYLLSLVFTYSIASAIIFSVCTSLKKSILFGFAGVILTMLLSNFDFIYQNTVKYFTANGIYFDVLFSVIVFFAILTNINLLVINFKKKKFPILLISLVLLVLYFFFTNGIDSFANVYSFFFSKNFTAISFWDHSRVIPYTINEFPYYSLIVGDLHPHYIDLMFFSTNLALLYIEFKLISPNFVFSLGTKWKLFSKDKTFRNYIFIKVLFLLILSCALATNSWELIAFSFIFFIKDLFYIFRCAIFKAENKIGIKRFWILLLPIIFDVCAFIGALILQIPFLKSVNLPVSGIKFNSDLSPLRQFSVLWVIFIVLAVIGFIYLIKKLLTKGILKSEEHYVLVLFVTSILLIIFTELFFISDLFYFDSYSYRRANTVFKLNYMGFVMFGIGSSWVLYKLFPFKYESDKKFYKRLNGTVFLYVRCFIISILILTLAYIPLSIYQWAQFNSFIPTHSLNSLEVSRHVNITYADDTSPVISINESDIIDAAEYLKLRKNDSDVLVEAPGEAYKFTSIGSTFSTVPSVIGWVSHEAQWRKYTNTNLYKNDFEKTFKSGDYEEEFRKYLNANVPDEGRKRADDVNKFFTLDSSMTTILKKYNITYVWVGPIEKHKYGDVSLRFSQNKDFELFYKNGSVNIYKVMPI